ncbi:MAG: SPFH domain-containing protein [Planctomycetes bacterium]|nr:SPFH domain-containing protein [Planctomycetota bacterium]
MGLFAKLRGELVDIIEWLDDSNSTLVWRFPRYHNQIKNGAKLIVRPGQVAIFVHEGKLADIFEQGTHTLETRNLPILGTLQGWKYGFDSPYKAEVYFVSTRTLTDLKWGTPNPVMMRDPEFGPIRLRAFGTYTLKARDPKILLTELVGTDGMFDTEELGTLMRGVINQALADVLGSSGFAALDLAQNYQELAAQLNQSVNEKIDDEYGLEVPQLFIVNISLPEQVEKALDTRTSMGVIGDMGRFQQYQMGQAMTQAASNPAGGGASEGMGLGMGFAMANQMMRGMGTAPAGGMPGTVPPPPPAMWHVARDGQSLGPLGPEQLQQQVATGQLTRDTLVWCAGMPGWQPAGTVPQLAPLFGPPAPPPPPPPPA